jgi:hypothetical protein
MMLIQNSSNLSAVRQTPSGIGLLREFVMRQDRLPVDQRVDLPEIQESFRVNFSDAALAASAEGTRNVLQTASPSDERGASDLKLRAYMAMAAL